MGSGSQEFDFALPPSHLFYPGARGGLVARVAGALGDWRGAVAAAGTARALVRALPALAALDAARLLRVTLHADVLACSPYAAGAPATSAFDTGGGAAPTALHWAPAAYLLAAALHYVAPAASSTLHTAGEVGDFDLDAGRVLHALRGAPGALAFVRVVGASPRCARGGGADDAAAPPFGHGGDVVATLSWRALPLAPHALAEWADALRASPHGASELRLRGALLGVLQKTGGGEGGGDGARAGVELDPAGALVWAGGGAPPPAAHAWAPEDGHWADARRLGTHGAGVGGARGGDAPAEEQAEALEAEGVVDAEGGGAEAAPRHVALLQRVRRAATPSRGSAAAMLCAQVDFRAALAGLPEFAPLCWGTV